MPPGIGVWGGLQKYAMHLPSPPLRKGMRRKSASNVAPRSRSILCKTSCHSSAFGNSFWQSSRRGKSAARHSFIGRFAIGGSRCGAPPLPAASPCRQSGSVNVSSLPSRCSALAGAGTAVSLGPACLHPHEATPSPCLGCLVIILLLPPYTGHPANAFPFPQRRDCAHEVLSGFHPVKCHATDNPKEKRRAAMRTARPRGVLNLCRSKI